ncbi:leucine-rich repeat domain-containing protein [Microcoleus sp. LEGE 07076]|uniref:leucine-rich repeat domain-containing protein n=1 Tax=Microcoleus sp. LEGE 07076 TaxID=915322 RepID=UPI00187FEFBB|nr:leucine-rich repeat domain-containing protein [Microcoleus sp. LEGE 07076]MBE9188090.1 leucine-rich repeat domain-containing protein [Microcoleus sp. LEGE 07076]
MNLPKLIAIAYSAIVLASCTNQPPSLISEPRSSKSGQTFAHWCCKKADLSVEAKRTVEVLLQKAGTTECDAADRKLFSLAELSLSNNSISDIKPLESLTKLTKLVLEANQIYD